jgi:hypothetical protein
MPEAHNGYFLGNALRIFAKMSPSSNSSLNDGAGSPKGAPDLWRSGGWAQGHYTDTRSRNQKE